MLCDKSAKIAHDQNIMFGSQSRTAWTAFAFAFSVEAREVSRSCRSIPAVLLSFLVQGILLPFLVHGRRTEEPNCIGMGMCTYMHTCIQRLPTGSGAAAGTLGLRDSSCDQHHCNCRHIRESGLQEPRKTTQWHMVQRGLQQIKRTQPNFIKAACLEMFLEANTSSRILINSSPPGPPCLTGIRELEQN